MSDLVQPMLLGITWMDPDWLLSTFGTALFWVGLLVVFVECGLFFPFLPGDTLLIALGVFIAGEKIDAFPGPPGVDIAFAAVVYIVAAIAGNWVGYEIGRAIGPRLYARDGRFLKKKYFDETEEFFAKHGNKALVIGRWVPFVRTYVTVVAGVTRMDRRRFLVWSFVGAVAWVAAILLVGYFVGARVPWLADNIDYAIIVILLLTAVPIAFEAWRRRRTSRAKDVGGHTDVDILGMPTHDPEAQ